jgi:zinc protease
MLFKGTSTRGTGRIDQEVQAAGGYMNAYTSFDRTVYWINVPNTGTTVAVDVLCDILQHATLPQEELVKELEVIRREMAMGNDDPGRRSGRRLFERAFTKSPYRYPVIGIPDIFDRLTREDIARYYTERYTPNNCFLVIVGDMDADAIVSQIEIAFADAKARSVPASLIQPEPGQLAPREWIEETSVELAHFHLAWQVPELRHADTPILDVLATLLGSGRSSRLYQAIRERAGLVHGVSGWLYSPGSIGLFGVSGLADADKLAAARDEILAEIQRLQVELVSSVELTKAVKQFTAATLSTRKTMEGQAQDLGSNWLVAHDLNFSERYLAAVRRITPEDLRRAANEHLHLSNRTFTAIVPTGTKPSVEVNAPDIREHHVEKFVLPNGLRLLVKPDHRLPFVQFRAIFHGGLLVETVDRNGLSNLMTRMLVKGTKKRTGEELAAEIEGLGGSLEPFSANQSVGLFCEVLSGDFAQGLELFSDTLLNPVWPESSLTREKEVQRAALRSQKDQILQIAVKAMRRQLFNQTGYGLDILGTESSLSAITTEDLGLFHRQWMAPNQGVLAVFGDVHPEAVRGAVETALHDWQPSPTIPLPTASHPGVGQRWEEVCDKEQAVCVIGFPGSTVDSDDRFALELIQEACSDMGSRLFLKIREELSLAYYVGASNFLGRTPGYFAFYCGTAPNKVADVERELLAQAARLAAEGLSSDELTRAKAKILGQRKIARQDLGHQAMAMALDELYGLGYDHDAREDAAYAAVTDDQIRAVANRYLQPEKAVIAIARGTAS